MAIWVKRVGLEYACIWTNPPTSLNWARFPSPTFPNFTDAPPNPFIPRHVILMHIVHFRFYPRRPSPNPQITLPTLYINIPSPFSHFLQLSLLPLSQISIANSQHFSCPLSHQELALAEEILEDSRNKGVVTALYEALNNRDAEAIERILAPDLEWWFHGPPTHQFLMRLLTGERESSFRFVPHSISAFGPTVLAEGFDQSRSIAWVHAWTVTDGVITQLREYLNTSLTVTRIGKTDQSDCSSSSSSIVSLHCPSLWESSLPGRVGKSVPGLVLAL